MKTLAIFSLFIVAASASVLTEIFQKAVDLRQRVAICDESIVQGSEAVDASEVKAAREICHDILTTDKPNKVSQEELQKMLDEVNRLAKILNNQCVEYDEVFPSIDDNF